MDLEEYTAAVVAALQEAPYDFTAEDAQAAADAQPKSMRIFHANETVADGTRLIAEGTGWTEEPVEG